MFGFGRCAPAVVLLGLCALAAAEEDAQQAAARVEQLLESGKLDDAQRLLDESLAKYPDSQLLQNRRFTASLYLSRTARHADALQQIDAYISFLVRKIAESNIELPFTPYVERAAAVYVEADQVELGLRRMDELLAKLAGAPHGDGGPAAAARIALLGAKASLLAGSHRGEEARQLVDEILADARAAFERDQDDPHAILRLARSLALEHRVAERWSPADAPAAAQRYASFLSQQVAIHSDQVELLELYGVHELEAIGRLMETDWKAAEARMLALRDFLAGLDAQQSAVAAYRRASQDSLAALEKRLQLARLHASLVNQPAPPLGELTWLGGSPLQPEDLQGKVILLDFWAIWCGPCISTFPELRTWHEKYAQAGLVIVGITRRDEYDWNSVTKRVRRTPGLSAEQQNAAIAEFAAHHRLKYPLAVADDPVLHQRYGVLTIPQRVIIDREGKVRMIRVGAGGMNSEALESLLAELLAPSQDPTRSAND